MAAQLHGGLSGLGLPREDLVLDDVLTNVALRRRAQAGEARRVAQDLRRRLQEDGHDDDGADFSHTQDDAGPAGQNSGRGLARRAAGRPGARARGGASPARAFEDSPWCSAAAIPQFGGARLYEELAKRHENARFILTVRESQSWWASVERWVAVKASKKEKLIRTYTTLLGVTRFDNETFIEAYEEHNRRVQDFFSDQPDRLLVVDLREATWSTFCVFLEYRSGCPSGDLRARTRTRLRRGRTPGAGGAAAKCGSHHTAPMWVR